MLNFNLKKNNDYNFVLIDDAKKIKSVLHDNPQITYSGKILRRSMIECFHTIKLSTTDNKTFNINYINLCSQIPKNYLFLFNLTFYKNGIRVYPDFRFIFGNLKVEYIGKLLPYLHDKQIFSHVLFIISDINVVIHNIDEVDEIYANIIAQQTGQGWDNNILNYYSQNDHPRYIRFHKKYDTIKNIDGYIHSIFLDFDNIDNIKYVELMNNNVVIVDNVSPYVLQIDEKNKNLLCINLGCGEHGNPINIEDLELKYKLKDENIPVNVNIYAEKMGIIS